MQPCVPHRISDNKNIVNIAGSDKELANHKHNKIFS